MHPLRDLDGASLPLVQLKISSILATPHTVSTVGFVASFSALLRRLSPISFPQVNKAQELTGWPATYVDIQRERIVFPSCQNPFLQGNLSLASRRREHHPCPQRGNPFYNQHFIHGVVPNTSGNNSHLFFPSWGTVVGSGSRACSHQRPGIVVCSHCWGFSVGCLKCLCS